MKGRVRWNEANLDEIEANKPVRQKLLTEDTLSPYDDGTMSPIKGSFNDLVSEDSTHEKAIRSALTDVATSSRGVSSGWTLSDDDTNDMEQDDEISDSESNMKKSKFRERRSAHYDEFRKAKELIRTGSLVENEEADENHQGEAKENHQAPSNGDVRDIIIEETSPTFN